METDVWFSIWAAVAGDPSSGSGWAPNTSKSQEIVVLLVWDLENTGSWSSRTRTQSYLTVCSPMSLDMDYGIDILFPTFYRSFSFIASSQVTKGIISLYSQGLHSTLPMMVCCAHCSGGAACRAAVLLLLVVFVLVITALFLACYGWRWLVEHFER